METYVFDMGNVITRPAKLRSFYQDAEMTCGYDNFKRYFYHSKQNDDVCKGLMKDDDFFYYIKELTGTKKSVSNLKRLYYLNKGGIFFDTIDIIKKLKNDGNSIHLLSNLKEIDFDYLKENININLFDKLFLSYKLGMIKPNEDIFNHVINNLGTNRFHFFDDTKENIIVANKLGIDGHQTTGKDIVKCMCRIKSIRR